MELEIGGKMKGGSARVALKITANERFGHWPRQRTLPGPF
jgi:hypothetical protein